MVVGLFVLEASLAEWRCSFCGATFAGSTAPFWCSRCAKFGRYYQVTYSPAVAPPSRRPVKASSLGGGEHAPSLGATWDGILGRLGQPVKIVLWGPAGSRKTSLALDLGQALSSSWGKVLYDAVDEGFESISFRDKLRRIEVRDVYLMTGSWGAVAAEISTGDWAVCVLDTGNAVGATPAECDDFSRAIGISWVVLLEETKGRLFKGTSSWAHWSDILLQTTADGELHAVKNRFGQLKKEKAHV